MYLLFDHFVETVIFLIGIPAVGTCIGPWAGVWGWAIWIARTRRPVEKNDKIIRASIGIIIAVIGLALGLVVDIILVFGAFAFFSAQ